MADTKWSQFPSQTPVNADEVVGLHSGDNARFSIANIVAAVRNGLASIFVPLTRTINGKGLSTDITLDASDVGAVDTADVGVADGVASLDSSGKVPGTQLDLSNTQSKITASGILKGDGAGGVSAATPGTDYQAPLIFDATPTANSTNPVQSGGVYTDVRTRVPNYGKGVNLLRNWYFVGGGTGRGVFPVNQRGVTSGQTWVVYGIDGWEWDYGGSVGAYSLTSDGVKLTPAASGSTARIIQIIDGYDNLGGKKITASVLLSDGTLKCGTITRTNATNQTIQDDAVFGIDIRSNGTIRFLAKAERTLQAIKLELGSDQTLAHQENGVWVLNEIPDYEYELYRCITSTADSSDTYANKSLATEQQLAYVETGTTASRTYARNLWISWQGKLYSTDKIIPTGSSFYTTGGDKNLTEAVAGGINEVNYRKIIISTSVILEISGRTAVFRSKTNSATSTDIRNSIIPQDYRPSSDVVVPLSYYNGSIWVSDGRCIRINSSTGAVTIYTLAGGTDTSLSFNFSAFCATWIF